MELIAAYRHRNDPDIYTFVFDDVDSQGEYMQLAMPDAPEWPSSPFAYGPYAPEGANGHLGERVALQQLGHAVLDRFFSRLGY